MKHFIYLLFFALCATASAQAPAVHLMFNATLNGGEVVPAVNTNGTGMITLLFNEDRTKVMASGLIIELGSPVTGVYLHYGKSGENGDTLLNMSSVVTGRRVAGELDVPAGLLAKLLLDQVYVSVRTNAYPNGEIRGQFAGEADVNFRTELTGAEMVPPVNSTAIGIGGLHFPTGSDDVDYAILIQGFSSPITGAAIYEGHPGENGTLVTEIPGLVGGNIVLGLIDLADVNPDFIQKMIDGKYYVVVRTANFPDGEIRGQVRFLGYMNSLAPVNALQPVPPPSSTTGFGMSFTYPNETLDTLYTTVLIRNITPNWASIRLAPAGANGPVLYDLDPTPTPGLYRKTFPVDDNLLGDFLANRLYIAFGTNAYPNGEIRGQIKNSLRKCYAYDLCGNQEVPANPSTALGMAMASIDQADCYLNYKLIVDGLGGAPTEAYIRQGNLGEAGPILYSMDTTKPFITGFHAILATEGPLVENEGAYMSIHTPAYPDGEVRGQMRRGLSCPLVSSVTNGGLRQMQVFPNPASDWLYIEWENTRMFDGVLRLHDMSGKTVWEQMPQAGAGIQRFNIPVRHLPPGTYRLSIGHFSKSVVIGR